jgi:uncharacterized paraquat-inducible protein A
MDSGRNAILTALYSLGALFVTGLLRWILLYWPALLGAAFLAYQGWDFETTLFTGIAVVVVQGTWTLLYVVYMSSRNP